MGLTPGGAVFCAFVILWTAATALASGLVVYVYAKSRTKWTVDFISLISTVVTVAMLSSLGQQIYTAANWDELKERERQDSIRVHAGEVFYDTGSDKVVSAFYYIQILCYNIGGSLVLFWTFWLWANIWPLKGTWWRRKTYLNVSKSLCIILCVTLFGLSQLRILAAQPLPKFLVANVLLIIVLGLTPILFVMILYRFVVTRLRARGGVREMQNFPKEQPSKESSSNTSFSHGGSSNDQKHTRRPSATAIRESRTRTLSTMLMIRFIAAIVIMSGLETFHICFQIYRIAKFTPDSQAIKKIPITTGEQIQDTYLFLPATTQGWLVLLVFGTTEDYWQKIVETLANMFCLCGLLKCKSKRRVSDSHEEAAIGPAWMELRSNVALPSEPQKRHILPPQPVEMRAHGAGFAHQTRPSEGQPGQSLQTAVYSWSEASESLDKV